MTQAQKPQGTALQPIDVVKRELNAMAGQFQMVLPPHVSTEKFVRIVITALQKTPKLLQANRHSLFGAAMAAAQDGLLPDGREGAIVPFKDQAQWMPMAKGLLKLVRNSGELGSIAVECVYSADKFSYRVTADGAQLEHEPALFAEERGEFIGVYAVAKTKDGDTYVEVMNRSQVEQVRSVSRNRDGNTWSEWYDEMAKKSVIRRLSKRLPMSTDLESVLERDNANYDLNQAADPAAPRPRRIDAIVGAKTEGLPPGAEETEMPTPEEKAAQEVDKL